MLQYTAETQEKDPILDLEERILTCSVKHNIGQD